MGRGGVQRVSLRSSEVPCQRSDRLFVRYQCSPWPSTAGTAGRAGAAGASTARELAGSLTGGWTADSWLLLESWACSALVSFPGSASVSWWSLCVHPRGPSPGARSARLRGLSRNDRHLRSLTRRGRAASLRQRPPCQRHDTTAPTSTDALKNTGIGSPCRLRCHTPLAPITT